MKNLNEALADLRETLIEDGFTATLVSEIAADYEINPALLARKFEEKHSRTPAEYKALSASAIRNARIEKAMEAAIKEEARYSGGDNGVCGRGFKSRLTGDEFIAITISTRGLIAIRVEDGATWTFGKGRSAVATAKSYNLI